MRLRSFGVAAVAAALLAPSCEPGCTPAPAPTTTTTTTAPPKPPEIVSLVIDGQGNGHGRGLSQWGGYGSAVNRDMTWQQILAHYYGGTAAGTRANAAIRVRLTALDGAPYTAVVSAGRSARWSGDTRAWGALMAIQTPAGTWDVFGSVAPQCPGPSAAGWVLLTTLPAGPVAGPVTFTTAVNQTTAAPGDVLGLCQGDGSVTHYRGSIIALRDGTATRTVNDVLVENYLRGVLPREIYPSWGTHGGGKGMHALRAMAVAARSYALSQGRYPYARTCDTSSCQVYGGSARRSTAAATTVTSVEWATTNQAVAETAGVVRVWPSTGALVSTEYSATHGPRSAGGTFPAVDDSASNVPANPLYTWRRTIDVAALESRYGLGNLTAAYTERDPASPSEGVWANRVVLRGTAKTVVVSALAFRTALRFPSHGFTITSRIWR